MNCIEGKALRTSFHPEMAIKSNQLAFSDEFFSGNGINVVSGDDFSIEDLLDFSNEDVEEGFIAEEEGKISVSVSSQERTQNDYSNSRTFPVDEDFSSVPILTSELSVPAEVIADLEWLSNFVEDSFSEFSLIYQAGNSTENRYESEIEEALMKIPCFPTKIPVKARSKRSRAAGRVWSIGSPSLTESSSTSSSSSSNSSSSASSLIGKPPSKKQKKKPATESSELHPQRRCCHCHVQKTPQWRAGPLGAKTLCNACGVRYKSGRLWPEYRPACSPTFSGEIHSNSHRKVLEMRSKKQRMTVPEYGSPAMVQSF